MSAWGKLDGEEGKELKLVDKTFLAALGALGDKHDLAVLQSVHGDNLVGITVVSHLKHNGQALLQGHLLSL